MNLDAQIEAILFFKAEPMKLAKIAELLNVSEVAVGEALTTLEQKLEGRGVILIRKDGEATLGTAPETSELIDKMVKEDLSKDLGKATLETLTIILYRSPVSKPEIDYVRGVNSNYILRSLLVRGLIEKIPKPDDQRSFLYRPTFQLLEHLGISDLSQLPEKEAFAEKVSESMQEFSKDQ